MMTCDVSPVAMFSSDLLESIVARFEMERPMVGIQIRRTDKVGD